MNCNRCGSPLPSHGYVCKQCGMMMSSGQLEQNRKWNKENNQNGFNNYNNDFKPLKTNKEKYNIKIALIIVGILLFLIVLAILKAN